MRRLRWLPPVAALIGLALIIYGSAIVFARDDRDYADRSPRLCSNCHEVEYEAWARSGHGLAFEDQAFQAAWERVRQSPDCLTCHSPSINAAPRAWEYEGVGCGACHRILDDTRRAGDGYNYHGTMSTTNRADDCGTCHGEDHALTYREWELSAHNGARTVDCSGCHVAHTGGISAPTNMELCGSCHLQEEPTTNPHMHQDGGCTDCHPAPVNVDNVHMHGDEPIADCPVCHMVTEPDRYGRYLSNAGHSMEVELAACFICHGELHDLQPETPSSGG